MTKEIEKESVDLVCPHCSGKIKMAWVCTIESVIGVRYVYFCADCQRMLGIFSSKGLTQDRLNIIHEKSESVNRV